MKHLALLMLIIFTTQSLSAQAEDQNAFAKMDWKEYLPDLYKNITPTGGKLKHSIEESYKYEGLIQRVIVEFDSLDFTYTDPMYGEQNASSNFQMYFAFGSYESKVDIKSIYDVENKEMTFDKTESIGAFSNTLILIIDKCRFGEIKNGSIPIHLDYFLTNESGLLTGTVEDHSTILGTIKTSLRVADLIISVHKETGKLDELVKAIPSDSYKVESLKLATDANVIPRDYDLYQIPVRLKN